MKKWLCPVTVGCCVNFLLLCISCNHESKDALVQGKWQIDKLQNKKYTEIQQDANNKVVVVFNSDGTCLSIKGEDDQESGTYKLSDDGTWMTTHMNENGQNDSVRILTLNKTSLKIVTPARDTILFKKIK